MRQLRRMLVSAALTGFVAAALLPAVPPAWPGGGGGGGVGETEQVIREGQVVEIQDTTITIHEWAGKYTYRLSPEGRQSLQANQIKPGDKVRFKVWAVWEIAFDFRKM